MFPNKTLSWISYSFLWLIIIVIFEACTGWIRGLGWDKIDNAIMLIKYFILTSIVLKKRKDEFIPYFLAVNIFEGIFLFAFFYSYAAYGKSSITAWPNMMMGLLGCWSAFLYYRTRNKTARIAITGIPLALLGLVYYKYNNIDQFNWYGTFSYTINQYIGPDQYALTDAHKETVRLERDVTYVLDFWHTACGACFKKFPHFNKQLLENKNPRVKFVSVNRPIKSDEENQAFEMLEKYNYSFPVWKGSEEEIEKVFGVRVYPTIIVLRNDTMLYKGTLGLLDEFLDQYEAAYQ